MLFPYRYRPRADTIPPCCAAHARELRLGCRASQGMSNTEPVQEIWARKRTESQNHRISQVGRNTWTTLSPTPCSLQGYLKLSHMNKEHQLEYFEKLLRFLSVSYLFFWLNLCSLRLSVSLWNQRRLSQPLTVQSGSGSPSEIADGGTKIYLERGTCYCFIKLSGNIFKLCLKTTKTFICQNILTWKCMNYWSVAILDVIFWDCCFYWNSINFMVLLNFSD